MNAVYQIIVPRFALQIYTRMYMHPCACTHTHTHTHTWTGVLGGSSHFIVLVHVWEAKPDVVERILYEAVPRVARVHVYVEIGLFSVNITKRVNIVFV